MNLLFDLDGTLTDSSPGIFRSILFAMEKLQLPPPKDETLRACIGPPLHESFLRLTGSESLALEGVRFYRERYSDIGLYENTVYLEIPETLKELQQNHRLLLATSKYHVYAEKILQHFSLDQFFTGLYGSSADGRLGDKGELLAHLLSKESIPAASCLMIGDRKHDVLGAKKNQIPCIGVEWGFGSRKELTEAGAWKTAAHPLDLLSLTGLTQLKCHT